jgi:hypothetical protein
MTRIPVQQLGISVVGVLLAAPDGRLLPAEYFCAKLEI